MVYSFLYLLEAGSADDVLDSHSQAPQGGNNFLKNPPFFFLFLLGVAANICVLEFKNAQAIWEKKS